MSTPTFLQIKELLDSHKIIYKHLTHEPVGRTSEDAAKVRGTSLDNGVKAIILKIHDASYADSSDKFFQVSIPGLNRIDVKKLKEYFNIKSISLASPDEVLERTGCTVGSVPPFGNLFDMKVYADNSLLELTEMLFSAGSHTDSIIMDPKDYLAIVNPILIDLRKE